MRRSGWVTRAGRVRGTAKGVNTGSAAAEGGAGGSTKGGPLRPGDTATSGPTQGGGAGDGPTRRVLQTQTRRGRRRQGEAGTEGGGLAGDDVAAHQPPRHLQNRASGGGGGGLFSPTGGSTFCCRTRLLVLCSPVSDACDGGRWWGGVHGGWSGVEWSCSGVLPRRVEAAVRREVQHRTLTHPVQRIPAHTTHTTQRPHVSHIALFSAVGAEKVRSRRSASNPDGRPRSFSPTPPKPSRAAIHHCLCLCLTAAQFRQP